MELIQQRATKMSKSLQYLSLSHKKGWEGCHYLEQKKNAFGYLMGDYVCLNRGC